MSNTTTEAGIAQNPLLDAIKSESNADLYLCDVTIAQFIADVEALIKEFSDKGAIKRAIAELQKLV